MQTSAIMSKFSVLTASILLASTGVHAAVEEAILSGRYEFRADQPSLEIVGKQVCFFPSGPSARLVPRPAGDSRLPWFCFSNSPATAEMLGFSLTAPTKGCGLRGVATVTVSDYVRYTKEGDGNDVATLKVVQRKSTPEPLPCSE